MSWPFAALTYRHCKVYVSDIRDSSAEPDPTSGSKRSLGQLLKPSAGIQQSCQSTEVKTGDVTPASLQAASSLGLTRWQSLLHVQLPQAASVMLAGVKTAAVINVGTATLAAFVGAGGFGEPIVSGLAVNDTQTMLAGAVPAAVLALGLQGLFNLIERRITPGVGR